MNPGIGGAPRRASVRDLEQILMSRITRGEYPVGARLPSCERLGRELGANKNTVSKAYQVLARRGYTVSTPGRGTFVTRPPVRTWGQGLPPAVTRHLRDAIAIASEQGLTADELETLAVETIRLHFHRGSLRIGYVDCNRTEARELARDLGTALSGTVEPLVVADVGGPGARFDVLAVNVSHLRAVERRLRRAGGLEPAELVPMVALPTADTLTRVAILPAGSRLLVMSDTEEVLHTLTGLARGVNPAINVTELLSSNPRFADFVTSTDAVLVTRTAHRRLAKAIAAKPTIVASFRLDEQSVADLATRREALRQPVGFAAPVESPAQ